MNRRAAIYLFPFLLSLGLDTVAAHEQKGKPGRTSPSEKKVRQELEVAANRFIAVIEKGDPKDFPGLCSRTGVHFSVDWPVTPVAVIRKGIEKRRVIFCGFFDTSCLRKEDAAWRAKASAPPLLEPLFSYRERLQRALKKEVKVAVWRDGEGWAGYVEIILEGDIEPGTPLEFEFVYEDGDWKLTGVPFW